MLSLSASACPWLNTENNHRVLLVLGTNALTTQLFGVPYHPECSLIQTPALGGSRLKKKNDQSWTCCCSTGRCICLWSGTLTKGVHQFERRPAGQRLLSRRCAKYRLPCLENLRLLCGEAFVKRWDYFHLLSPSLDLTVGTSVGVESDPGTRLLLWQDGK